MNGAEPTPTSPDTAIRVRLDIAYDGTDFSGWAAQPRLRTVEGELSAALTTVLRAPAPVRLHGHGSSSRSRSRARY